jgi:hypothetical protein
MLSFLNLDSNVDFQNSFHATRRTVFLHFVLHMSVARFTRVCGRYFLINENDAKKIALYGNTSQFIGKVKNLFDTF